MRGGDYVLMARRRAGLTQRELADRLGLRQATIARWERGDRQVGIEDIEAVAEACGLQLDAHLVTQDRSWWSQIALQLELDPLERLRRLTPPDSPDLASALDDLAASADHPVVVGEVAGALQGWPLALRGGFIDVCARATDRHELGGGVRLRVLTEPSGTAGLTDLWRGSERVATPAGDIRVASLVDLLRIADASTAPGARRNALAYQAVLDVHAAQAKAATMPTPTEAARIDAWLATQKPMAT